MFPGIIFIVELNISFIATPTTNWSSFYFYRGHRRNRAIIVALNIFVLLHLYTVEGYCLWNKLSRRNTYITIEHSVQNAYGQSHIVAIWTEYLFRSHIAYTFWQECYQILKLQIDKLFPDHESIFFRMRWQLSVDALASNAFKELYFTIFGDCYIA
jgi:hypothetical protein